VITLSKEQEQGLSLLKTVRQEGGVGVLIGEAGSGKSTGLNIFRKEFPQTVVIAPTGLAAINVGGTTVHRLMGWRPGVTGVKNLNTKNKSKVLKSGVIVIDEMSMLRADAVDRMHRDLVATFKNPAPFGGIGIYFIGDPFQLEPVVSNKGAELEYWNRLGYESPYFFSSHVWKQIKPEYVRLTKVFRQSGNDEYRDALNLIRRGRTEGLDFINERAGQMPAEGAIKLCFRNDIADEKNRSAFLMLGGESKTYVGRTIGEVPSSEFPSPEQLTLKVGARVIATANHNNFPDDPVFINGDLGTVVAMKDDSITVEFDRGITYDVTPHEWECGTSEVDQESGELQMSSGESSAYIQFPLKLAWAISVHKSQGMTLERVHIDCGDGSAFASGMAYVALSRCRHFETMSISRKLTELDLRLNPHVVEWYQDVERRTTMEMAA
jgi:hypothetical protein